MAVVDALVLGTSGVVKFESLLSHKKLRMNLLMYLFWKDVSGNRIKKKY